MFSRRFKNLFARICIALLFMQAAVAAYACPVVTKSPAAGSYTAATPDSSHSPMSKDCSEPLRDIGVAKLCHQHYAGDLSGSTLNFAFAPPALDVPVIIVSTAPTVLPSHATVRPVLLHRATGPALAIRFQVLRI